VVLDGSVPHVFSLAVFEEWMYWTDWNHMAIEKANRFTGANRTILVNVTHRPMTIRLVHPLRQRQSELYCRVNGVVCVSTLTLQSPVSSCGYTSNVQRPKVLTYCF